VLDEAQIKRFATEFDPQPSDLDNAAKTTLFGSLAASGWHTAAVTMRLLVQSGLPIAGGIISSGGELSWLKPTRPGDTLSVESEIVEITHRARSQVVAACVCQRNTQSAWRGCSDIHGAVGGAASRRAPIR